jgi:membrane-bound lytic murein transglycosylase D
MRPPLLHLLVSALLLTAATGCRPAAPAPAKPAPVPPAPKAAAEPAPARLPALPPPPGQPSAASTPAATADADALFAAGQLLFDAYAPPEIKARFEFPTRGQWDGFLAHLQAAMDSGSMADLAALEPEARTAAAALRALPGYEDYADWLDMLVDNIEAAKEAERLAAQPPPSVKPPPPADPANDVPLYALWVERLRARPAPARAAALLPQLKAIFAAEGLPPALVWLAETESAFNPAARSPAGARGLFQLMPATARELGLSTTLPDERTDPEKNARASARMLRRLHGRFGSWPLALAAYNAGEGRVSRLLAAKRGKTFADIAADLPAETRLYVPKVLATLALREGVAPGALPAPAPRP